ncbi:MAG: hypothetical protein HRU76_04980 [Phycisphaeraceae bacterium]|nr:MAG: hypothetical protein HRU76_04980 [Phycisphaeraceae bacterium]
MSKQTHPNFITCAAALLCLLSLAAQSTAQTGAAPPPTLEAAFEQAASYEQGQPRLALRMIERAAWAAASDEHARAALEKRLLAFIELAEATREARRFAIRQLALVGGGESVVALMPFIDHPDYADVAIIALDEIDTPASRAIAMRGRVASLLNVASGDSSDPLAASALERLRRTPGDAVDAALAHAAATGRGPSRVLAVRLLGERGAVGRRPGLEAIANSPDAGEDARVAACLAIVATHSGGSPVEVAPWLTKAMQQAESADNRRTVLAAIEQSREPALIALSQKSLDDPQVGPDAAAAVIALARVLEPLDRDGAMKAAKDVHTRFEHAPAVRAIAAQAIAHFERNEGFITRWHAAGPYMKEGVGGGALIDEVFPPELSSERDAAAPPVSWQAIDPATLAPPAIVDLARVFGGGDRVAYLRAVITSDREQRVRLEMGSDDGIKAWLNGAVIHRNNAMRGLALNSDVAEATLKQGENILLLKITQGNGDWKAAARIRSAEGLKADGWRTD